MIPNYRIPIFKELINKNPDLNFFFYTGESNSESASGISVRKYDFNTIILKKIEIDFLGNTFVYQKELWYALKKNKPDVIFFEGSMSFLSTYVCYFFAKIYSCKIIFWGKGWSGQRLNFIKKFWIKNIFIKMPDRFVVYGKESKKELVAYGIDKNNIFVAQNTVDLSLLLDPQLRANMEKESIKFLNYHILNKKILLYVGRLVKQKRVDWLIKAFVRMDISKRADWVLVIGGRGPEKENLMRLSDNEFDKSVFFIGQLPLNGDYALISRCQLYVQPGAPGLTLNQAMSAGVCVLCADEEGPDSELVIHEETGVRFSQDSFEEFQSCLARLMTDDSFRDGLGQKAYKKVASEATVGKMVEGFLTALNSV